MSGLEAVEVSKEVLKVYSYIYKPLLTNIFEPSSLKRNDLKLSLLSPNVKVLPAVRVLVIS